MDQKCVTCPVVTWLLHQGLSSLLALAQRKTVTVVDTWCVMKPCDCVDGL